MMADIIEKLRGPNPVSWLPEAIHEIERLTNEIKSRQACDRLNAYTIDNLRAENERLKAENKTLVVENEAIAASARAVTAQYERLRAALESVLDSGLLVGPTVMHDKIRGQTHAALALRQYQANEVCMGGDA